MASDAAWRRGRTGDEMETTHGSLLYPGSGLDDRRLFVEGPPFDDAPEGWRVRPLSSNRRFGRTHRLSGRHDASRRTVRPLAQGKTWDAFARGRECRVSPGSRWGTGAV